MSADPSRPSSSVPPREPRGVPATREAIRFAPAATDYACPDCNADRVVADRLDSVGICAECGWFGPIQEDADDAPPAAPSSVPLPTTEPRELHPQDQWSSDAERRQRYWRERARADVEARGFSEGGLQMMWRTSECFTRKYDQGEVIAAICDALTREGCTAWSGDGTSCVEQMIRLQWDRARRAEETVRDLATCYLGGRMSGNQEEYEAWEAEKKRRAAAALRIQWQEVSANAVVDYFVDGFKEHPQAYEWFFDPAKGKFLLKLYMPVPSTPGTGESKQ